MRELKGRKQNTNEDGHKILTKNHFIFFLTAAERRGKDPKDGRRNAGRLPTERIRHQTEKW